MSRDRFGRYVVLAQRFGARVVFFQSAAARHLDLTATELQCFRLVQHEGPVTASDLAQETGLTRASISVVIDKLVARGFLHREQDCTDRRSWLLEVDQATIVRVDAVYAAHARRVEKLLEEYSDQEFEVVLRFMDLFADELKATAIQLAKKPASKYAL